MEQVLLADFGSTFTKVVAVDVDSAELLGVAQAPTTVREGLMSGLRAACAQLKAAYGIDATAIPRRIAASSAAGGLKMVAVGLVPELTVEAARRAALGAGAKLLAGFAYELTAGDVDRLLGYAPDMVLLAGGTDGGNKDIILGNARALAASRLQAPVVIAGNRSVADEAAALLTAGGKECRITKNVMPDLGKLDVAPARAVIRDLFMARIVHAKGLDDAESFIGGIVMPTPAAVLAAAQLLAVGTADEPGLGDLIVVDVGGATTDVHSLAAGIPTEVNVAWKGLPEPYAKRTVEGDLGVRVSLAALVETVGEERLRAAMGQPGFDVNAAAADLTTATSRLPSTADDSRFDLVLGRACVERAVERHVGHLEINYTPLGATYVQYGKDLTACGLVIGTGGPVIRSTDPAAVLGGALFNPERPELLKPKAARLMIDADYVLAAAGLLAEVAPRATLRLIKAHLKTCET